QTQTADPAAHGSGAGLSENGARQTDAGNDTANSCRGARTNRAGADTAGGMMADTVVVISSTQHAQRAADLAARLHLPLLQEADALDADIVAVLRYEIGRAHVCTPVT